MNVPDASPIRWKDEAKIYPDSDVVAEAMNDPGQRAEKTKNGKKVPYHKFPLVMKLAAHLLSKIKEAFKPDGLTVNATRPKEKLMQDIVISRNHVDVTETHPNFHKHAKDGKVYIVKNEPKLCGLDQCVENFQQALELQNHLNNTARTKNDALRLAGIMMDPACRTGVSSFLSKTRKKRAKSDITGDPNLHLFEKLLTEAFSNSDCEVPCPPSEHCDLMPEEEKGAWDPNDPLVIEKERTASWLKDTWDTCLRKKYKLALDKWNKDTGGGDGTINCFIEFCGSTDRWLQFVFAMDAGTNWLLANNAGGRIPRHITIESEPGFESTELSSISDESPMSGHKRKAENELEAAQQDREVIRSTLKQATSVLERLDPHNDETEAERNVKKIASFSVMMQDDKALKTMTPRSKDKCAKAIEKERSDTMKKL